MRIFAHFVIGIVGGYIGTEIAYGQGGYETGIVSRVAPKMEEILMDAMQRLLGVTP